MHTAALPWLCYCFLLWWRRGIVDDIAFVATHNHSRLAADSTCGQTWRRKVIIDSFFRFPLEGCPSYSGYYLLSCHAYTLPLLYLVQKKGRASLGATGVQPGQYPLIPHTLHFFSFTKPIVRQEWP